MASSEEHQLAISVRNLFFSFGGPNILSDVTLELPLGSRCLLVGCNGVGKSTLLRILAGKRMVKSPVLVLGRDSYHETPSGITYLGPEWAANPVVRRDVQVSALLDSMDAHLHADRCRHLLELLDIDVEWRMHQVSDGERRRVQILLGLLQPFQCLLLDEVTVDLDVVVRKNLLNFLRTECLGSTIVYATHIFDGLGEWPTHIAHMSAGTIEKVYDYVNDIQKLPEFTTALSRYNSPLLSVIEKWLQNDFIQAKKRKKVLDKAQTHWDELSENAKKYGDKYYNYWNE